MAPWSVASLFCNGHYKQVRDRDVASRAGALPLVATRPLAVARPRRADVIFLGFGSCQPLDDLGAKVPFRRDRRRIRANVAAKIGYCRLEYLVLLEQAVLAELAGLHLSAVEDRHNQAGDLSPIGGGARR